MVSDIPSEADFRAVGLQLLNTAWETAATLLSDLQDGADNGIDADEIKEAYWQAARTQMSAALAVAQQGCEFLLKSRIVAISPYLLLASTAKDWPTPSPTKAVPFADFRTIDAQDLVKTLNTVSAEPLNASFVSEFEHLRRKRNTILHSVDKQLNVHVTEVLKAVLVINEYLGEPLSWPSVRHGYLDSAPQSQMYSADYSGYKLVAEFKAIREALQPSELKRFFGFDKKLRTYVCGNCEYSLAKNADSFSKTATLTPNSPESTTVYCFVCREVEQVLRQQCSDFQCKGNVISLEWERCLSCGNHENLSDD